MRALFVALLILAVAFLQSFSYELKEWRFVERLGSIWLERGQDFDVLQEEESGGDTPPVVPICKDEVRLEYIEAVDIPLSDEETQDNKVLYQLYDRIGKRSIRPLHIWGYYDIFHDDCKSVLGWGTAFVIGLYGDKLIWATVEHNVDTKRYWRNTVATQWFVRDEKGNWRELYLVGCSQDRYCILISNMMSLLPINLFDDEYITNDIKVLDKTYLYGCSLVPERIRYAVHYRLHFFCLGNEGYVSSRYSIKYKGGGDFLISNPAMPGFSGSPVLIYKDKWLLVGTVNSGIEGVFTAVHFLNPSTIKKVKEWLSDAPFVGR